MTRGYILWTVRGQTYVFADPKTVTDAEHEAARLAVLERVAR